MYSTTCFYINYTCFYIYRRYWYFYVNSCNYPQLFTCRLRLKCDGTRAETRFRLSAKRTSPFKSTGASVQSTTGSRGVRISGSDAGYTMFRGSVKCTGYPLHSPVSPSLPFPFFTVCHHISTGVYRHKVRRIIDLLKLNYETSWPSLSNTGLQGN